MVLEEVGVEAEEEVFVGGEGQEVLGPVGLLLVAFAPAVLL